MSQTIPAGVSAARLDKPNDLASMVQLEQIEYQSERLDFIFKLPIRIFKSYH